MFQKGASSRINDQATTSKIMKNKVVVVSGMCFKQKTWCFASYFLPCLYTSPFPVICWSAVNYISSEWCYLRWFDQMNCYFYIITSH